MKNLWKNPEHKEQKSHSSSSLSENIKKIFTKKVANISPKLDYIGIFQYLENENISLRDKKIFIENQENINLETIIPILENKKIKIFHILFIDKLDGIELSIDEKFFKKTPTNTDFFKLIHNKNILPETIHIILRTKNHKKFPLKNILPYIKSEHSHFSKEYLVNRFIEEQNWENIRKIIPKITQNEAFIVTESLMQMSGFIPFSEIKNFLQNQKIPDTIKEYLAWKCENNISKTEIIPLIEAFWKNFSIPTLKNLLSKTEKNLSLDEWKNIIQNNNSINENFLATASFVILDAKITDSEIDNFLQENNFWTEFEKQLLPYREKNFKNISRYGREKDDEKEKFSLWNFLSNSPRHFTENIDFLKKHISAYQSDGSMIESMFMRKMKDFPEKNIYDLYRETASHFLKNKEIVDEKTREKNNKKLVDYQKKLISEKELQNAKNIGIDTEKFELTLYIRYEHMVNFPEIAELIAVFVDEYIDAWHSKYFSNIRILPRNAFREVNIHPFLQSLKTAKYYNVIGIDAPKIMNIFASCLYMSHSANAGRDGIPNITSRSMKIKENDIASYIELESRLHNEKSLKNLKEMPAFHIFKEIYENLKNLENEFDNLLQK